MYAIAASVSNPDVRKHFCTYPGKLSFINANSSGEATSKYKSEPLQNKAN